MKKAFTLVELIVVIGIIGILAAVLLGTFSGGTESAKSARCLSNLRNLASACQSAGVASHHYPLAGSIECIDLRENGGTVSKVYSELNGWISWYSRGAYAKDSQGYGPSSHQSNQSISMYSSDLDAREFCLTNGALWRYVGNNRSVYVCPKHATKMKGLAGGRGPAFSYVMNAYFLWDRTKGKGSYPAGSPGAIGYGQLKRADRVLLFSEIPFADVGVSSPVDESGEETDPILQYKNCKGCGTPETIGFNHKSGKGYYAHVAFADGHVEKLVYPKNEMSETELQDLTQWLCQGTDYSFNGTKYEKFNN